MEKKLNLTKKILKQIKSFSQISDEDKKALYSKLEDIPVEDFDSEKVKFIFLSVLGGQDEKADSFVDLYMHLIAMQNFTGKLYADFLALLRLSNEDIPEDKQITSEEFKDIETLLKCSPHVEAGFKAANYQFDHDKVLLGSRVYEELRPVFGMNGTILGNAATHILKLTYRSGGDDDMTHSVYIGLDNDDVVQLKEQLEISLKHVEFIEKEKEAMKIIRK
ncbi:MAG: hypothetical protein LKI18_03740 [Prevotella sp.]|jgi:hypothetical protein|nr:hypothetical protein [Prevotella sp.]